MQVNVVTTALNLFHRYTGHCHLHDVNLACEVLK
jgi:hypothetical protein